jgi:hypothetical protein
LTLPVVKTIEEAVEQLRRDPNAPVRMRIGDLTIEVRAVDGVSLPEGSTVTVIADGEDQVFEATAEEEGELLEAIAGVERGETVRAEEVLERLRR